jgi:hypothetical protein
LLLYYSCPVINLAEVNAVYILTALHDVCFSPNVLRVVKSRRMRWAGHVARVGERRGSYRFLVEKLAVKRSLGKPRRRWENTIKMDHQNSKREMDWIAVDQDRNRLRAVLMR